MLTALSPGRSVDSQLNNLTKELRLTDSNNLCRAPSVRFDFALRGEEVTGRTEDSHSSDARIYYADGLEDLPVPTNDVITSNLAAASGSSMNSVSKLRKVRHANNVILTKSNLTVSEVLERIAEALRKNSIRFTLKR
ncbi:unnamed protein product [Dibothriocephalus latus]|uniref:Uncharacterized protein n=1 Tax=Dibothriocephalus latus TaxID=60516 RepID=A0A3P7LJD2_DIBLA|nr:unnamed protein product [Dibothriocephalus latus]